MSTVNHQPARVINVRALVLIALLSAISTVLYFLDFPLPIFLSFLKIDFSDIPAVVGAYALGPLAGVAVQLVKNLLHLLRTSTMAVGELANFVVGSLYVLPAAAIYRLRKNSRFSVLGLLAGTVIMTLGGVVMNYFVTLPFFMWLYHMPESALIGMANELVSFTEVISLWQVVVLCVTPFNLFKGMMISIVSFVLHKYLGKALNP